jgi:hypothetical protein
MRVMLDSSIAMFIFVLTVGLSFVHLLQGCSTMTHTEIGRQVTVNCINECAAYAQSAVKIIKVSPYDLSWSQNCHHVCLE